MPNITVNKVEIYYELHGPPGADVLILSNGILMSTASWAFQIPALSQHYQVLVYDCRGMWQSGHPPGPYSMNLHAEDLEALMNGLGIHQAHIGGISYGAEISMVFARRFPDRTLSLIISSAVSQIDPYLKGQIGAWMGAVEARDPEMFYRVTYPVNFSEAWIADNAEALAVARERYESLDMTALLELLKSFINLDITADLHHIKAPTLVIVGEEDQLKPRKYAEIIVREIPHAEYAVIPQAGHAVLWEKAEVFNSLILGFLAKHQKESYS
jgi:3-oxoadipate enol-lactonase